MPAERSALFSDVPVRKAVLTLAVPTVISQLITVVYNMADTFFIGQLNDPLQVAATTLAMPCFMFLTAFANLFGLGGSSLISRCLGSDEREKARHTAAFCIWTGVAVAFLYGVAILLSEPVLFPVLGAKAETWDYLRQYVFWTIGVGAVPTVMNAEFAHLIRSEGYSRQAGFGVALGGVLNIALDPLFIFAFRLNIAGAAVATMLSNVIAMLYFVTFLLRIRKKSVITLAPKAYSVRCNIPLEVITIGLSGFVMTMMSTISNTALNHMVARYSNTAIAGMGIAKKIDLLAYAIAQGMTQGTLPLIGYNYGAGEQERVKKIFRAAFMIVGIIMTAGTLLGELVPDFLMGLFTQTPSTVEIGRTALRLISPGFVMSTVSVIASGAFEGLGMGLKSLKISLMRYAVIIIPIAFVLSRIIGPTGVWHAFWLAELITAVYAGASWKRTITVSL